jgi:hypothetical protein
LHPSTLFRCTSKIINNRMIERYVWFKGTVLKPLKLVQRLPCWLNNVPIHKWQCQWQIIWYSLRRTIKSVTTPGRIRCGEGKVFYDGGSTITMHKTEDRAWVCSVGIFYNLR